MNVRFLSVSPNHLGRFIVLARNLVRYRVKLLHGVNAYAVRRTVGEQVMDGEAIVWVVVLVLPLIRVVARERQRPGGTSKLPGKSRQEPLAAFVVMNPDLDRFWRIFIERANAFGPDSRQGLVCDCDLVYSHQIGSEPSAFSEMPAPPPSATDGPLRLLI